VSLPDDTRTAGTDAERAGGAEFDSLVEPTGTTGEIATVVYEPTRIDAWFARVMASARNRRLYTWGAPAVVVIVAAFTRLFNLGAPHSLVFDETFYVKDAWTLWNLGYSASWPVDADKSFNVGLTDIYETAGSFVVHPPLAKWIIGLGIAAFGPDSSVGWRISTAVVGVLAVVLLMLIAKKLFDSTLLAVLAGGLFAIEGNAIVMSRVALLDNYVMFFALLGFGAILLDRAWTERRLALWTTRRTQAGRGTDWGPSLWWRPWLMAAGLAFGLTSAVKWSGFYFIAAFAIYSLVVDALARRRAGVFFWGSGTLLRQAPVSFLLTVPIAAVAHMSTWISWFTTDNGYYRHWAEEAGNAWTGALAWVPLSVQSWWHYQASVYAYHVGEMRPHSYQANPLTWLFMVRPTSMYYQSSALGENGCDYDACGASITGLANPLIWWAATAAIFYLVYRLARYREWRVGLILMGMVAGYLPWLAYLQRTVFQFYTIAFEPYMILGLVFVIGLVLGRTTDPPWRRDQGIRFVAVFLVLATLISVFFWPLWTGMQLDVRWMQAHWWLPTWR
jgi:dolichyl-phosphate-mannose-protein mannosyltransferase